MEKDNNFSKTYIQEHMITGAQHLNSLKTVNTIEMGRSLETTSTESDEDSATSGITSLTHMRIVESGRECTPHTVSLPFSFG